MKNTLTFLAVLAIVAASSCSSSQENLDAILRADGSVLRSPSTGKIYLVSGGQRHYVANPAMIETLGIACLFRPESDPLIDAIPGGADLPAINTKLVQNVKTKELFLLEAGKRRYIPDAETMTALNLKPAFTTLSETDIALIPLGPPLPHTAVKTS